VDNRVRSAGAEHVQMFPAEERAFFAGTMRDANNRLHSEEGHRAELDRRFRHPLLSACTQPMKTL